MADNRINSGRREETDETEHLILLYNIFKRSEEVPSVALLPGAGSSRRYYRIEGSDGFRCIGVCGDNLRENEAFCRLTERFSDFPVPRLYLAADDFSCYLVEDLGSVDLFSILHTEDAEQLIEHSILLLARMQCVSEERWSDAVMCRPFSRRQAMWDLNYFKYEFAKPSGADFDEELLEDDFEALAECLVRAAESAGGFMYRDFQSRNVMVEHGQPRFIDYQGGRRGPSLYDAVSFLWQAKARFPDEFRRKMLDVYAGEYCRLRQIEPEELLASLPLFVLFRTLQVLGAYGFRGLVEHKAHFIESIPFALETLESLAAQGALGDYPELGRLCARLCNQPKWKRDGRNGLTVSVFSFSYKKGYPEDLSGNGGGFMFDCRAMHNPGRYEQYKRLTGLDAPVREFLEERGEIQPFIAGALALVCPAVERYAQRGFTGLQIGFGCTGGQHRSVYSAQAVAEEIARRYPDVRVELLHREQGIRRIFSPADESMTPTDNR